MPRNAAEEPPVAVFVMHPAEAAPISAVVVPPGPDGSEAEVRDLRAPDASYLAPAWTAPDDRGSTGADAIVA